MASQKLGLFTLTGFIIVVTQASVYYFSPSDTGFLYRITQHLGPFADILRGVEADSLLLASILQQWSVSHSQDVLGRPDGSDQASYHRSSV